MDFQSDNNPPDRGDSERLNRPTPAPFDDMLGSLPNTRPITRAPEPQFVPPTQSVTPQMNRTPKPKKSWLWRVIGIGGVIVLVLLASYFTYSWQHAKVVSANKQIVAFNKTISTQLSQINLLQETVPTLVPISSSYTNWTSYTLKNEKASFQYPKSWKLVDSSAKGSDSITITSPNNFVISINTGAAVHTASASSLKLIGYAPINFSSKFGYFDFVSNQGDGLVEGGILSQSPINIIDPFSSVAQGQNSSTTGNFTITSGYSSSGGTGESQSLPNASKDASYQTAQLLIESIVY